MGGQIEMERKGCELVGCWTHYVTLNFDLDLGFSKSNFEKQKTVSHEWEGMWTDKMLNPLCNLKLWSWPLTLRSNYEIAASQEWEGRLTLDEIDWVDRLLDPLPMWHWPITLPMTLGLGFVDVKFSINLILRMGGSFDLERQGCEPIRSWSHYATSDLQYGFARGRQHRANTLVK